MIRLLLLVSALTLAGFTASAAFQPALPDSIGVEYRNNKILIKHRVAPGETLYGISRRYKVPVDQIVEANPQLAGGLAAGQVVLVPRTRVVLTPAAPATAPPTTGASAPGQTPAPANTAARALPTDAQGNKVYTVEKGMTLYAIARRFETTPAALAKLNQLPVNSGVQVGQTLLIVPAGAGAAAPARPTEPAAPAPPTTGPRPAETDREESATERAPERASEIVQRVRESGLAANIEGVVTDKYLALHKTAPVGTIMQVRNIMNNQTVYVRVIGLLPDTGENNNILVRLSPRAVQRLATPNSRFRVETSYVP